jgi:Pectin methylesterase
MKKYLYALLLNILSVISVTAQTQIINGIPRDTSYTVYNSYIKESKRFPFIKTVDTVIPPGIESFSDIVYKKIEGTEYGGRELKLSVYRPNNQQKYAVVLMIHGGGWNSGTPDMQKALAVNLAKKGFVTVTVEYRLTPEALYPSAEDDLNDAVKWLHSNADAYYFDKEKIAVSGCSAGGQLASLIGTKNRDNLIKAIVNIDGISTFINPETVDRAQKARDSGNKIPVDALWLGGTYREKSEIWKGASPLCHVNNNSAPVCFINSSIPRFHQGRDEHIRRLDSLHIYSETHTFEDTPHTFWLFHPWHLSTVNYAAGFLRKIFDRSPEIKADKYDFVVAQDGTGNFRTIQEAINAVPDFRKQPTRIFIRNGIYREKIIIPDTKHFLSLIGEDKYKTILSYNDFASKKSVLGDEIGTSGSASCYVCPDNFAAENITFENAAGPVRQAVSVIVRSDRARFINCRFIGFQDTLYTHKPGSKQYYKNCYIEGTVDFIFGSSTAYFDECDIFCKQEGYITAASTPKDQSYGYVFHQCRISGENKEAFYLGRPWRPYAHVVFIGCELGEVIKTQGWHNWGKMSNEETVKYAEYENTGEGADTQTRVPWLKQLTDAETRKYSIEKVLEDDFFR